MKITTIFLALLGLTLVANAQIKAVTETGEEVILDEKGTWKYINAKEKKAIATPRNLEEFEKAEPEIQINLDPIAKPETSTFLLKSTLFNVGFYLNPKKWAFFKADGNTDAEYELQSKSKDLSGIIISEKTEIPLPTLRKTAFENAKAIAPDLKILSEEYRMVNGNKVLMMNMEGTMQGTQFSYLGYYYSNKNGTVQFLTYTSKDLMKDLIPECEELLNGLTVL